MEMLMWRLLLWPKLQLLRRSAEAREQTQQEVPGVISFKEGQAELTKNQFVYLVTHCLRDLPYTLELRSCSRRYTLTGEDKDCTVSDVYRATQSRYQRGFLEISIKAKDIVGGGRNRIPVSITMEIEPRHLRQPDALVKDITSCCAHLVSHEVQEVIGRKTQLDRIIPHGTDKLHLVPDWIEYAEN